MEATPASEQATARAGWPAVAAAFLGAAGSIAVLGYALSSKERATAVYAHGSYWIVLALVMIYAALFVERVREARPALGRKLRESAGIAAFALAVAIAVFVSVPPRFRVLSDETNLLGISQSMVFEKTVYNPTMAWKYFGNLYPEPAGLGLDQRPLLFPFAVQCLHAIRGYDPRNSFGVNFAAFFALLAVVGALTRRAAGPLAAGAAVLLIAGSPLVSQDASSGGFELFATCLLALSLLAAVDFMKAPGAARFSCLFATLLLLCHTRYESPGFAAIILLVVMARGGFRWRFLAARPWLYAAAPLLVAPVLVRRALNMIFGIRDFFERGPEVPAFSFAQFRKSFASLVAIHLDFGFERPYAAPLQLLALGMAAALLVALLVGRTRIAERRHRLALVAGLGSLALGLGLYLSFFGGDPTRPDSARYYVTLVLALAYVPVLFHMAFPRVFPAGALLALALASALVYHPVSIENRFNNSLFLERETEAIFRFVEGLKDDRILCIHFRPGQLVAVGFGAINFPTANAERERILTALRRRLVLGAFAFQMVNYDTGRPMPDYVLDPAFHTQVAQEVQITATEFLRISRILPD
jgi:hypothetical protein